MAAVKKKRRKKKKRYHTGAYTSIKTGQVCKYRSGWELVYLKWLDESSTVKTFEYEALKIPYVSNVRTGKIRHYLPDFLVEFTDATKHLVEIKPKRRVSQIKVQKKLKAAEAWCREHGVVMTVITEVELKVMGLL